jgi:hypothetical protein
MAVPVGGNPSGTVPPNGAKIGRPAGGIELQLWEQQKDEPYDDYGCFLLYRNLGPGRTLQLAYLEYRLTFKNADREALESEEKLPPVPGSWATISSKWDWVRRSDAWDVHVFELYGERAVIKFVNALEKIAEKSCQALARPNMKPKTWHDVLEALAIIQQYAQPGSVNALRERKADPRESAGDRPRELVGVGTDDGVT